MMDNKMILEAIALKRCIEVTFNRMRMKLAPHILYSRHGELFLDAVAVEREGRTPDEAKLGRFKVAGLQIAQVIAKPFQPLPAFNAGNQNYREATLVAVGYR